jgi:hypothetical protein
MVHNDAQICQKVFNFRPEADIDIVDARVTTPAQFVLPRNQPMVTTKIIMSGGGKWQDI